MDTAAVIVGSLRRESIDLRSAPAFEPMEPGTGIDPDAIGAALDQAPLGRVLAGCTVQSVASFAAHIQG